jgi:adenine phosphoribosyltransferase
MNYKEIIREVPDFPKKGINFYDITTLLENKDGFNNIIEDMVKIAKKLDINKVAAIEARGFIFGSIIANKLNLPFIPIRKPGKLPYKTIKQEYALEYGVNTIEMHIDAVTENDKVLIIDDLLATGGTVKAAKDLIEKSGAKVSAMIFAIELLFLKGKEQLEETKVFSIIKY